MTKNIKYKITDVSALRAAYPTLFVEKTVTREVLNHKALYALIKGNVGVGVPVVGIELLPADAVAETTSDTAPDADDVDDAVNGNDDDEFGEDDGDDEDDSVTVNG